MSAGSKSARPQEKKPGTYRAFSSPEAARFREEATRLYALSVRELREFLLGAHVQPLSALDAPLPPLPPLRSLGSNNRSSTGLAVYMSGTLPTWLQKGG